MSMVYILKARVALGKDGAMSGCLALEVARGLGGGSGAKAL